MTATEMPSVSTRMGAMNVDVRTRTATKDQKIGLVEFVTTMSVLIQKRISVMRMPTVLIWKMGMSVPVVMDSMTTRQIQPFLDKFVLVSIYIQGCICAGAWPNAALFALNQGQEKRENA